MEGREEVTMEGQTRIKRGFRPSLEARRTRPQRVSAGASHQTGVLRARLIAASVELVANGSDPRLIKTRDIRETAQIQRLARPSHTLPTHIVRATRAPWHPCPPQAPARARMHDRSQA